MCKALIILYAELKYILGSEFLFWLDVNENWNQHLKFCISDDQEKICS